MPRPANLAAHAVAGNLQLAQQVAFGSGAGLAAFLRGSRRVDAVRYRFANRRLERGQLGVLGKLRRNRAVLILNRRALLRTPRSVLAFVERTNLLRRTNQQPILIPTRLLNGGDSSQLTPATLLKTQHLHRAGIST